MKTHTEYVVTFLWQGERHRSLPTSHVDALDCAAEMVRKGWTGVAVQAVQVYDVEVTA